MKYCPFCGTGLSETMAFCPKCGKQFSDTLKDTETIGSTENIADLSPAAETTVTVPPLNNTEDVDLTATGKPKQARKFLKKTAFGSIFAFTIILGVIAIFVIRGYNDNVSIADAATSVLYLEVCDDTNNVIATASGFIIEDGTTLVTNYHVINGAHHIIAYTPDRESSVAIHTVLAYDEGADLAVLKCDDNIGVSPLLLGNSDTVKQGNKIFAVGYPLGVANTLSDGVVSSRYLDEYGTDILQITAAISSGSSGGALFNKTGQVIGVICASYIDGQNLNIAISSNTVKKLLENPSPTDLADFYIPIYTVDYVIDHFEELGEKDFYIDAWVSTNRYWHNTFDQYLAWIYCVNDPSEVLFPTGSDSLEFVSQDYNRFKTHEAINVNYSSFQPHEVLEELHAGQRLLIWGRVNLELSKSIGGIEITATDFLIMS